MAGAPCARRMSSLRLLPHGRRLETTKAATAALASHAKRIEGGGDTGTSTSPFLATPYDKICSCSGVSRRRKPVCACCTYRSRSGGGAPVKGVSRCVCVCDAEIRFAKV